jgi:histone-lysine N-methyltransferase SETMAR
MSEVLIRLSEWLCARGGRYFRNLKVHADNARPHKVAVSQQFMARKGIVVAAHPPYSPDLASSDFYLFGHMKDCSRESHSRLGQLLSAIKEVSEFLDK